MEKEGMRKPTPRLRVWGADKFGFSFLICFSILHDIDAVLKIYFCCKLTALIMFCLQQEPLSLGLQE